ncbi:class I SAM-dependent methyltransferase [Paenibacillus sp. J5C_2022]|uniref:class I SAM-dependent methyltransferase n=1 Tax=Paenibacillus sp. J5C2022 TaxID=2977129 RepID=UPI0021CE41B0|nr:class I SAM-dependent methyltransferase [Paenibacillus sp. J5C2022]MCU6712458.1 class I SAM-dependent methyltransferase [Paenibacillus sp. J5C2022]
MIKPWYEQSFGKDYMIVYRHRDRENAGMEVRSMAQALHIPIGSSVLDIGCGMGRHALALAEAGYKVTGVDLSEILLKEARAHDPNGAVTWRHGDMRDLPFPDGSFHATVNMFTSFGYFSSEADNVRVLEQIRRVLKPGGAFLIDFLNPSYVARNLVPESRRRDEESGLHIAEVRSIVDGWVQKEITVSDGGMDGEKREYLERVKLCPLEWFQLHLPQAGLRLERILGHYDGSPYEEAASPRMIMVGRSV